MTPGDATPSAPEGAGAVFDAHLHIIDPRYPAVPNHGFRPEPFTVDDYRAAIRGLGVAGGAVVAGSFQGRDPAPLLAALEALGPSFVGVAQLPAGVPDARLLALDRRGVRAVRFNLRRGTASVSELRELAARAHDVAGWHAEVYLDGDTLAEIEPALAGLPSVVIDHLGLTRAARRPLLRLVERGARVKASGFGRLDFDPVPLLRDIARADPGALLFGTDLPSTRAPRPFRAADLRLIEDALDPTLARRATGANARDLYRPAPGGAGAIPDDAGRSPRR